MSKPSVFTAFVAGVYVGALVMYIIVQLGG